MTGRESDRRRGRGFTDIDKTSALYLESTGKVQSWLGPYPVMKVLPTFEDITFRKLRGSAHASKHLGKRIETSKERDEHIKTRRAVRKRRQQARKKEMKKIKQQLARKSRREQHERNTLSRRARGLPSHRTINRHVGQKKDGDNILFPTERLISLSKEGSSAAELTEEMEIDASQKKDEEDDDEDEDEENSDSWCCQQSDDFDEQGDTEWKESDNMEYDDASGELVDRPRKWGRWLNAFLEQREREAVLQNIVAREAD